MTTNVYDTDLAKKFQKTDLKPDKQFSFGPTIMDILGDIRGKTLLDLGCGDGFFTIKIADAGAKQVVGIDNSEEQIRLANEKSHPENVDYILGDIYMEKLPKSDGILAPFVINYAQSTKELDFLFNSMYQSLNSNGKIVIVFDIPRGKDLKRFGGVKTLLGPAVDGTQIKIDLYNEDKFICALYSYYYTFETLKKMLLQAGFKNIKKHNQIISNEGIEKFGVEFWKNFNEDSELCYISAEK